MYERQINTYIAAFLGLIGEVKLMEYDVFKTPLKVFLGIGVARDIHTVTQAYAWLHNCRTAMRREAHVNALQACKAAFSRQLSAEAARRPIERFADETGLLVPTLDEAVIASTASAARRLPA
ncbi:DUF982 domain-containing protein [Aureimonas frigidaquae]|uniref:Uncharacterized protein n=1 Tax=Aureimonas frigidaquae TaxID=424757 RepID=A0A0P0Z1X5_9HYPH|nr:DUF982 domain-containing protein [Aureimonas frigidaquae]BAT28084.1 hypothetical protein [Aureimonas frigidaquae]